MIEKVLYMYILLLWIVQLIIASVINREAGWMFWRKILSYKVQWKTRMMQFTTLLKTALRINNKLNG